MYKFYTSLRLCTYSKHFSFRQLSPFHSSAPRSFCLSSTLKYNSSRPSDSLHSFKPLSHNKAAFLVNSKNVEILSTPVDFYEKLKHIILNAKTRVVLSSLYIGTSEVELIKTIHIALSNNKQLQVTILVDYLRGTRAEKNGKSTAYMLNKLIKKFGSQRIKALLYHTPDLSGLKKKIYPPRLNETVGVMHIKAYMADDNVILSGANLSHDYFTNRQDRYFLFSNTKEMCDYIADLVCSISKISYSITEYIKNKKTLKNKIQCSLTADCPSPHKRPIPFRVYANQVMTKFMEDWALKARDSKTSDKFFDLKNKPQLDALEYDSMVIPSLQMGPLGIYEDQEHTEALFQILNRHSSLMDNCRTDITSAYFNFADLHTNAILNSNGVFNVLIASPEANGFYNASGISKYIPHAYTMFEKQFLAKLENKKRLEKVKIFEYTRKDWTYHGKGMWCFMDSSEPALTILGSSNLGERSLKKDLEAQFTIITKSENFQQELHANNRENYEGWQVLRVYKSGGNSFDGYRHWDSIAKFNLKIRCCE
ncbi:hypothetical protein BB561_001629 [Smittium simulii]|uniref:CDP-diacylglycerol--glycerol-3-phosphate 3-phosphatidyltransferase n=1 Tax=Smittium simulii TaxID=133385 RepID=A0A2T9YTS0_9FUNG|nr:hypothetical protein BB561_001629 [Smittium simulii]